MMEYTKPKISVIMVDGLFRERFDSIDYFCRQSISPQDYELIWVEFYDKVNSLLEKKVSIYPNARIVALNKRGIYHSSYCFNRGIQESRGDLIFIPDGDVVVESHFLKIAMKDHEENHKLAMYFYRKDEPKEEHKKKIRLKHLKKVCRIKAPSNYGACLSVRKKWLLEINGYDQHPIFSSGFHANGFDVFSRLKILGLFVRWHPQLFLYHAWHPLNSAGFPVYEVQKLVPKHRVKELQYLAYQGIDSSKNRDIPEDLKLKLELNKKKYHLDEVFDSWSNINFGTGDDKFELFYRKYYERKGHK